MVTIHPIVIGSGKRLFGAAESPFGMELVGSATTTSKGSVILRYRASLRPPRAWVLARMGTPESGLGTASVGSKRMFGGRG